MTRSNRTESQAAELTYGLLWLTPIDRGTKIGHLVFGARISLGDALNSERKRRGIKLAQDWLNEYPLPGDGK